MRTKEQAIQVIKEITAEYKNIGLGGLHSAKWKGEPTNMEWKQIGYISALSWAFDITPGEIGR